MYRIDPNWINPKLLEPRTTPHNAGCRGLQTKDKPNPPVTGLGPAKLGRLGFGWMLAPSKLYSKNWKSTAVGLCRRRSRG